MSSEKLAPALCTETNACQPNATVSSTVVTKRNQQVFTQQMITSRIVKVNSTTNNDNSSPMNESSLITSPDFNSHKDVKRTTKTYVRRIIRRIGPNGEVSEEIIEEGEPIISSSQINIGNTELPSITGSLPNDDSANSKISGGTKFHATAGFQTVSETGEQQSLQLSTGPMNINFDNTGNTILSLENKSNFDEVDSGNQLSLLNNSGNSVQQVLPDGTIVKRQFYGEKSATVTHSKTINGQTLTSSKSAFMSFSGESMLEANSSINDMEMIFGKMMEGIKLSSLDVLNRYITSDQNSTIDHLALAGGDMKCSLLALEATPSTAIDEHQETEKLGGKHFFRPKHKPSKVVTAPETINEVSAQQPEINKTTKDQQEEALIEQQMKAIKDSKASNRLYWSNMDEVKNSGILDSMQKEEIHLQEAIFEIITSEASYNISLDTLIEFYYKNKLLDPNKPESIINAVEKHHLFSNILLIKTVSLKLLKDLENRWSQQKPKLLDFADIILKHAEDKDFQTQYINYLTNQSYQIEALKSLLQKDNFKQALTTIQNNPQCCKLSLDSFLALPMQRLTRLKLLTDVVLKFMNHSKDIYDKIPKEVVENNKKAIGKLKELLSSCEENKRKMEHKARILELTKILDFGTSKKVQIGSMELIKEGEVKASSSQISANPLKKLSKKRQPTFYLIVLNELFIISKKKSPTKLLVLEYCDRNNVEASIHPNSATTTPGPKTSRASIGSQMSVSSSSSIDSTPAATGPPFVLKFNNDSESLLTDSLVLTVSTCESRDQWISAINSK